MPQTIHLIANNLPGYGSAESRCLPCSGVSGRVSALSPGSSLCDHRFSCRLKFSSQKTALKAASLACRASSTGHRKSTDFSRQNKQGFSRNRNRQNEERDNSFENLDESDLLTSKNGPLFSFSGTPKSQATAAPGPREKEIVELFRKVQAKLRERAAVKEDRRAETSKGKGKENETVESLLKLLKKHSIEQGKKKISNVNNGSFTLEQPEQNGPYKDDKNSNLSDSNKKERNVVPEPQASFATRPPSYFRRKSPVPQVKFQPIYIGEDPNNFGGRMQPAVPAGAAQQLELEQQLGTEEELDSESEPEPGLVSSLDDGNVFGELLEGEASDRDSPDEDDDKKQPVKLEDLTMLKLEELRALAKSRGVKGFSKMKKGDLVELLAGGSV